MTQAQAKDMLERAGWTFVQGFLGGLVVLAPALLHTTDLNALKAAALSVLVGAIASGFSALKTFVKSTL